MRLSEFILAETDMTGEDIRKWWLNVRTGEVIAVTRAHGDVTAENPGRFGIPAAEVERLKATPDDGDLTWWEWVRYAAQQNGWVRIGSWQDGDSTPYIYAANRADAKAALRWMIRQGVVLDQVDIEITDPDEPVEGYGDFEQLHDEQAIKRYLLR